MLKDNGHCDCDLCGEDVDLETARRLDFVRDDCGDRIAIHLHTMEVPASRVVMCDECICHLREALKGA